MVTSFSGTLVRFGRFGRIQLWHRPSGFGRIQLWHSQSRFSSGTDQAASPLAQTEPLQLWHRSGRFRSGTYQGRFGRL